MRIIFVIIIFLGFALNSTLMSDQRLHKLSVVPGFTIWDVKIGSPISNLSDTSVSDIACGTNGGPMSLVISSFEKFSKCRSEDSGLFEIAFTYDDEEQYIAKALNIQTNSMTEVTTVLAHRVIPSILVSSDGIIKGIRIMTDSRVPARDRARAITLGRTFENKYKGWNLNCSDSPLSDDELQISSHHIKKTCTGESNKLNLKLRLDIRYLRKKGQTGINKNTQKINRGYFESYTRLEIIDRSNVLSAPLSKRK